MSVCLHSESNLCHISASLQCASMKEPSWMSLAHHEFEVVVTGVKPLITMWCVCVFVLQDLKDEKKKARMAAARAVLEKCTMMLLTASKVNRWCTNTGALSPRFIERVQLKNVCPFKFNFKVAYRLWSMLILKPTREWKSWWKKIQLTEDFKSRGRHALWHFTINSFQRLAWGTLIASRRGSTKTPCFTECAVPWSRSSR